MSYFLARLIPLFTFSLAPEYQPQGSLPPQSWRDPMTPQDVGVRSARELTEKIWVRNAVSLYSMVRIALIN